MPDKLVFPSVRIVARFITKRRTKKSVLSGKHILFGWFLLLSSSLAIPSAWASGSCAYSSDDWADPNLCGHGSMTAIIVTTHDDNLESKLAVYDLAHNLPACTVENGCLEILTPFGASH